MTLSMFLQILGVLWIMEAIHRLLQFFWPAYARWMATPIGQLCKRRRKW